MGWNDRMDQQLLDDVDEMIYAEILDEEEDADLIEAIRQVAGLDPVTSEQQALYEKHVRRLLDELEEHRSAEWLEYQLSKDD